MSVCGSVIVSVLGRGSLHNVDYRSLSVCVAVRVIWFSILSFSLALNLGLNLYHILCSVSSVYLPLMGGLFL